MTDAKQWMGEGEARLRLVRAGPALLKACKAAVAATEDDGDPANLPNGVLNALYDAIAKAEGN